MIKSTNELAALLMLSTMGLICLILFPFCKDTLYYMCTDEQRAEIDAIVEKYEKSAYEKSHDLGSYYIIKDMSPGCLAVDKSTNNVFYREVSHDNWTGQDSVTMTPYMLGNDYLMYSLAESKYYIIRDDVKIYVDYN